MKSDLEKKIANVKEILDTLPTSDGSKKRKYDSYLNETIDTYKKLKEEAEQEIKNRYFSTTKKYEDVEVIKVSKSLNYNILKLTDNRLMPYEKMDLDHLFYILEDSKGNLDTINGTILEIVKRFQDAGANIIEEEFNYTEDVNKYMYSLLNNNNIEDTFNEVYFRSPRLLQEIKVNFKYLYRKYEKQLIKFYNAPNSFDYKETIKNHQDRVKEDKDSKHINNRYLYDTFINKELDVNEFQDEKKIKSLLDIVIDSKSYKNFEILLNLNDTLNEYKMYLDYKNNIDDFKELYSHKIEYKGLYSKKLKEISKDEKKLFGMNKKISGKSLFKIDKTKKNLLILERNKLVEGLLLKYDELDDLKIKDLIFRTINDSVTYFDILKINTYYFNYFVSLLKKSDKDASLENVESELFKLQQFIYDNKLDFLNDITILDETNLASTISQKYHIDGINITEDNLSDIDNLLLKVKKLIIYYDIQRLDFNLEDIKFLLKVPDSLKV